MTNCYCKDCPITGTDCGPWDDHCNIFKQIKSFHKGHIGFQIGEPNIENLTEAEQAFTDYFNQNIHEWFHNLNFYHKGSTKVCLIKDKLKMVNQA